jgi:hypothetical protein
VPSRPFDLDAVLAGLGEDDHDYEIVLPPDWKPHEPQEPLCVFTSRSQGPYSIGDNGEDRAKHPHGDRGLAHVSGVSPCIEGPMLVEGLVCK